MDLQMTPTTELPDEIWYGRDGNKLASGNFDSSGNLNGAIAYTRKDKADAEIANLRRELEVTNDLRFEEGQRLAQEIEGMSQEVNVLSASYEDERAENKKLRAAVRDLSEFVHPHESCYAKNALKKHEDIIEKCQESPCK